MRLPNKFPEFVDIVSSTYPKPSIISSEDELWKRFFWAVLINKNRAEAEVNYVYSILYECGLADRYSLNSDWAEYAVDCLNEAEDKVEEPNVIGKIGAIRKVKSDIGNIFDTLINADYIFNEMGISVEYLQKIAFDLDAEKNLVAQIASNDVSTEARYSKRSSHRYKIVGVAYTKALMWLHGCGVALELIPNNSHSIRFLQECDSSFDNDDFYVVNSKFKKICEKYDLDIHYAGLSLWYYESTKSLISKKDKRERFNPGMLIRIMKENDIDMDDLGYYLTDIDYVNKLKDILNS
ncbi:hypothetical protein [Methanolobus halotolerans]|uniref:Uncharacterized protein n=1 Tax=Methanolobus halotolerans TaxID=2052935 RepID=A0A4E0PXL6_9EURY|nr:hypothetical protein [Methanolobus halotolerans]TGC09463.1 hypothetical protein CUN85_06440 [Methanolobus halotolerans]